MGYQTLINEALRQHVEGQSAEAGGDAAADCAGRDAESGVKALRPPNPRSEAWVTRPKSGKFVSQMFTLGKGSKEGRLKLVREELVSAFC